MNPNFEAGFSRRSEEFEKTAFLGLIARGAGSVAKAMIANPMKSLATALTVNELASGAKNGAKAAARGAAAGTFSVGRQASF